MVHSDLDKMDSALSVSSGGEERKMEWARAMTHLYKAGEITWEDFKIFVISMGCVKDPESFKRDASNSRSIAAQKVRNEARKKARKESQSRIPKYLQKDQLREDGIEDAQPKRKKAPSRTLQHSLDTCPTCTVDEVCERCA